VLQVQLWSRLGRLKRSNFPKMTGGGHTFGGGAAPGLMSVLAGRLLCDTYLSGARVCSVLHPDIVMHGNFDTATVHTWMPEGLPTAVAAWACADQYRQVLVPLGATDW
jgi:hypothetical protein